MTAPHQCPRPERCSVCREKTACWWSMPRMLVLCRPCFVAVHDAEPETFA